MTADNSARFTFASKSSKYEYAQPGWKVSRTCLECGDLFLPYQEKSRFCKNSCRTKYVLKQFKADRAKAVEIAKAHVRVSFCIVCHEFCEAQYQGKLKRFCSSNCIHRFKRTKPTYRAKKARRDALKRSAKYAHDIDPIDVLARDNWTCYLCGIKTPKELRGSYVSNAPEVDHIIPLSKGGMHIESNLRCACRKCNIEKSDKIYQLI